MVQRQRLGTSSPYLPAQSIPTNVNTVCRRHPSFQGRVGHGRASRHSFLQTRLLVKSTGVSRQRYGERDPRVRPSSHSDTPHTRLAMDAGTDAEHKAVHRQGSHDQPALGSDSRRGLLTSTVPVRGARQSPIQWDSRLCSLVRTCYEVYYGMRARWLLAPGLPAPRRALHPFPRSLAQPVPYHAAHTVGRSTAWCFGKSLPWDSG